MDIFSTFVFNKLRKIRRIFYPLFFLALAIDYKLTTLVSTR
jgi:Kef-type K+ transport system membrane component KefB